MEMRENFEMAIYYFVLCDTISTLQRNTDIPCQFDSLRHYLMTPRSGIHYMNRGNTNRKVGKVDIAIMEDRSMLHSCEKKRLNDF